MKSWRFIPCQPLPRVAVDQHVLDVAAGIPAHGHAVFALVRCQKIGLCFRPIPAQEPDSTIMVRCQPGSLDKYTQSGHGGAGRAAWRKDSLE